MPPQFGYKQHELMGDIAVSVGGKFVSESLGDDLSMLTINDLGRAEKVIVGKESTIILRNESDPELIKTRVEELWVAHDHAKIKHERDFVKERIASLTGGIGVIYVGANSDIEQKEKYDRVDDAVCAVRSALEEGVLPGGGLALYNLSHKYMLEDKMWDSKDKSLEYRVANRIMAEALTAPMSQIMINAGLDMDTIMEGVDQENVGYDVKNDKYGDMFKMGVVDPLKVTKNALKNASSVATTILSTNAIVTLARTYNAE
jgi:chaperonin GroEL